MVTAKSDVTREEGTHIVTDQNIALCSGRGGSTGAKGEVGLPIPGVVVGLKFKVGYEKVTAEIVRKWG